MTAAERHQAMPPPTVTLTDRQQRALAYVRAAGHDGIRPYDLGLHMLHDKPPRYQTTYAKAAGLDLLRALKRKQLVRLRRSGTSRGGIWVAVDATTDPTYDTSLPPGMSHEIPY